MEAKVVAKSNDFTIYQLDGETYVFSEGKSQVYPRQNLVSRLAREILYVSNLSVEEIADLLQGKSQKEQFNIISDLITECGIIITDPALRNEVIVWIISRLS